MYAQGFAWSSDGVAREVLAKVDEMLPPALARACPARAAFTKHRTQVWGPTPQRLSDLHPRLAEVAPSPSSSSSDDCRVRPSPMVRVAHVVLSSAAGYAAGVHTGRHQLTADEPSSNGGTDSGPAPFQLMLAALAACTSITLRMYADRKGWTLGEIKVDLSLSKEADQAPSKIERVVSFGAPLEPSQRERLAEIVEKTPVTKTLKSGVTIETTVESARRAPGAAARRTSRMF